MFSAEKQIYLIGGVSDIFSRRATTDCMWKNRKLKRYYYLRHMYVHKPNDIEHDRVFSLVCDAVARTRYFVSL